jgi:hypothetical protein
MIPGIYLSRGCEKMIERYRPEEEDLENDRKEELEKDYVGYKRPPAHTRFKKGQSGNPRGRRPSSEPPSLAALLADELQSTITITDNGKLRKANKVSLIFKQAVNKAVGGKDLRPLAFLLKHADKLQRFAKTPTKTHPHKKEDISKLTLEEKMRRLKEIIANSKPLDEY